MKKLIQYLLLVFLAFSAPAALADDEMVSDPIEPVNRGVFWFNDKLDIYVLEPVAKGYDKIVHKQVREVVTNFFSNLTYPGRIGADLVSLEFENAGRDFGRFAMNTVFGLGGLFDVAEKFGLPDHKQDFGLAFARLGAGPGPYIVLPLLGPSNLRDTVGTVLDFAADPLFYLGRGASFNNADFVASSSMTGVKVVNKRAHLIDAVKSAKDGAVDYYLFVQGAYSQYRKGQLRKPGEAYDPFADDGGAGPDIFNAKGK